MMAELIDRVRMKAETRALLRTAQVSPKGMTALYLALMFVLKLVDYLAGGGNAVEERTLPGVFIYVLVSLLGSVLGAGFVMYCMAVRRRERAEYLTLFDGFSFVGKAIAVEVMYALLVILWAMLFVIPGVIAAYRYRFALYNLCENPGIGVMEALRMSRRQTMGYKSQLFMMDLSYIGWFLLSAVPLIVMLALLYRTVFQLVYAGRFWAYSTDEILSMALILPMWAWSVISGVWNLVVGIFYVANKECTTLGYFEVAKRTSGVGAGAEPPRLENGGWGLM